MGAYVTVNWLRVLLLSILTSECSNCYCHCHWQWHWYCVCNCHCNNLFILASSSRVWAVAQPTANYNLIAKEQKLISLFIEFAWQPSKLLNINFRAYSFAILGSRFPILYLCLWLPIIELFSKPQNFSLIYRTCWPFSEGSWFCHEIIKSLGLKTVEAKKKINLAKPDFRLPS